MRGWLLKMRTKTGEEKEDATYEKLSPKPSHAPSIRKRCRNASNTIMKVNVTPPKECKDAPHVSVHFASFNQFFLIIFYIYKNTKMTLSQLNYIKKTKIRL